MQKGNTPRSNVTVDDRRALIAIASGRKPREVMEVPHEQFIRNALKDRLGWPRREPAPQSVKDAAKQMASFLVARDKERKALAEKALDEWKAKHTAANQDIADAAC
jgi:hypothetical protein